MILDIKYKYFTTDDYNKFIKDIVDNSIKVATLATKTELKTEQGARYALPK